MTRPLLALSLCLASCARPAPPPVGDPPPPPSTGAATTPPEPPPPESASPSASAPAPSASAPAPSPPAKALRPLEGEPFVSLKLGGPYSPSVVALPLGATSKRPVLVATHGNYDRPEWQCQVWAGLIGARAFVLCPRGLPRSDSPSKADTRYEYANNKALLAEIDRGLEALREAHGDWVDDGPIVYTGFSLGAIMGVPIAQGAPSRFSRLVLIEGGDGWSAKGAEAFKKGGGARVLFACSQGGCTASARVAVGALTRAGVPAREVHGKKNEGHTYVGLIEEEIRGALPWLLEGDDRFAGR